MGGKLHSKDNTYVWVPNSSVVSLWHSSGMTKHTLGGKGKFNLMLEWEIM